MMLSINDFKSGQKLLKVDFKSGEDSRTSTFKSTSKLKPQRTEACNETVMRWEKFDNELDKVNDRFSCMSKKFGFMISREISEDFSSL